MDVINIRTFLLRILFGDWKKIAPYTTRSNTLSSSLFFGATGNSAVTGPVFFSSQVLSDINTEWSDSFFSFLPNVNQKAEINLLFHFY
uniref:Uncharacterized protein n=1 Tax=Meloidogyne enterolobii TaxID=390850 RepID=A0A6V7V6T6_MELEN|nr:unnamed protein product [Meloidogyne enterolobii]